MHVAKCQDIEKMCFFFCVMLCLVLSGIFLPYSSGATNNTAILGAGVDLEGKRGCRAGGVHLPPTHPLCKTGWS